MNKYIDADIVLNKLYDHRMPTHESDTDTEKINAHSYNTALEVAKAIIDTEKPADVTPVIHAHWELWDHDEASTTLRCSRCRREVEHKGSYDEIKNVFPYCHCGAKMDNKESKVLL